MQKLALVFDRMALADRARRVIRLRRIMENTDEAPRQYWLNNSYMNPLDEGCLRQEYRPSEALGFLMGSKPNRMVRR